MIKYFFIFLMLTGSKLLYAQNDSTARPADTVRTAVEVPRAPVPKKHLRVRKDTSILVAHRKDSLSKAFRDSLPKFSVTAVRSDTFIYTQHPFFSFTNPLHFSVTIKQWQGKEIIFYSLIALLIFFALIKNSSSRYMNELFQTYFRTTVRQRHIKDQLLQSPIASLMLNIFFLLSTGMFLALLIHSLGYGTQFNFWILFIYCMAGLITIYGVKFISLKFFGWIFQITDAIDTYIYIVFSTNKVIGIFLLPFLIILSFSGGSLNHLALTISIFMVLALFAYRYFLSYVSIHRMVHIGFFHFVIYFCAFEIAPLLLINKLLFRFLTETY